MSAGVIVGYDGSAASRAALRTALQVGQAYGETVTIAFGYDLSPVGGEIHDYHEALREFATARVNEARELASAEGQTVDTAILEEEPARGLVSLARERDSRVIVVGTRGEGPIRGALLGSTPHKLLQIADRPVLVVPAD